MASQNGQGKQEADMPVSTEAEITQAFKELARGEVTAAALEYKLSSIESKIEELLALASQNQQGTLEKEAPSQTSSAGHGHEQNDTSSNQAQ